MRLFWGVTHREETGKGEQLTAASLISEYHTKRASHTLPRLN